MNVALLPLLPKSVRYRGKNYRLLKDKHIFDEEAVATTDTSKDFFKSTAGKKKSQANFTGDLTLVKEANVFLVLQLQALVRDKSLTPTQWQTFFNKGSFLWNIIVPETVAVDEDRFAALASGPDLERFTTATGKDEAIAYDRSYAGRRTYLAGENKVVPGGRAIEFTAKWEEAGGNGLGATTSLSIVFAGGEYEPGPARG